jgi:hypothetical protein
MARFDSVVDHLSRQHGRWCTMSFHTASSSLGLASAHDWEAAAVGLAAWDLTAARRWGRDKPAFGAA